MSRGFFLTLEGIEGAGKSTVARIVGGWLARSNLPAVLTREPGGTPLAERVRQIALDRNGEPISAETETLLMFAARALHVDNFIRPALSRGHWVVCDRFTDATRAYQGSGRGVDARLIETLAQAVHPGLAPDCTLLLDLPVADGLARAKARANVTIDRFESETAAFFERVRAGYLNLARAEPQRFIVIDASAPLGEVERRIAAVMETLCERRRQLA
jgi:dTMP kinase